MIKPPNSLRKDLASQAMYCGPSFTLETLCQFYFTLIYICTGNKKKAITQQFGEFYLVLRMHAVTNER